MSKRNGKSLKEPRWESRARQQEIVKKLATAEHQEKMAETRDYLKKMGAKTAMLDINTGFRSKKAKMIKKERKKAEREATRKAAKIAARKAEKRKRKALKRREKRVKGVAIPPQYLAQNMGKGSGAKGVKDGEERGGLRKAGEGRSGIKKSSVAYDEAKANMFLVSAPVRSGRTRRVSGRYRNNKKILTHEGRDMYDFAGEYQARNTQYGHGRRKSEEWNDKVALGLKEELKEIRRLREEGYID